MTLRPGEPLTHEDIVFAEELGVAAIVAAAVTFIALALAA